METETNESNRGSVAVDPEVILPAAAPEAVKVVSELEIAEEKAAETEIKVEADQINSMEMETTKELVTETESTETEVSELEVHKGFESKSYLLTISDGESVMEVPSVDNVVDAPTVPPGEIVRTLFVSGLPMDASSRELYLLFRSYKGYVDCKLNNARNKFGKPLAPIGFVTFTTREDAEIAITALQDVIFDPLLSNTIRLEFAKCNSKLQIQKAPPQFPQLKKSLPSTATGTTLPPSSSLKAAPHFQRGTPPGLAQIAHDAFGNPYYPPSVASPFVIPSSRPHLPYAPTEHVPTGFYPHQPEHHTQAGPGPGPGPASGLPYGDSLLRAYSNPNSPIAFFNPISSSSPGCSYHHPNSYNQPVYQQQQQPTSTLFVANLGLFVTEKELTDVFANTPGFLSVTLYKKGISPVAFVKYIDVRCAALAMTALQGSLLRYSDRGGIRIEFAKSKIVGDRDDNISMCGSATGFSDGDNNFIQNGWSPVPLSALAPWMDTVNNWSVY